MALIGLRQLSLVAVAAIGAALVASCERSPAQPTPQPPPAVTPPTIASLTTAGVRAEVEQSIAVSAVVTDAEKPPSALTYVWSATAGTITGTGASVTWRLAKGTATTPLNVTISLTVVEPYQALENGQLVDREHRVTRAAAPIRVHDTVGEVSAMALHFLVDLFGDSSVSPDMCLVDFWPACPGTAAERQDIVENRRDRLITSVEARIQTVSITSDLLQGEVVAPCTFRDINLATQEPFAITGTCRFDVVYRDARWWLCSSTFVDRMVLPSAVPGARPPVSGYWRGAAGAGVK